LRCAKVILFFELPTLFCEKNYLLKNSGLTQPLPARIGAFSSTPTRK